MLRIFMKIVTNLLTLLMVSNLSLYANTCSEEPTTQNISSTGISQPAGATDIDNLQGTNCASEYISSFKIKTLPTPSEGILYLADGTTAVTVGRVLTEAEANGLKFDPADGFSGNATFTYASIDVNNGNIEDSSPATVTIPVTGGNGGACTEAPTTDDKANANILNSADAVDIIDLSGKDCANNMVEKFKITELPTAAMGILYMADGVTPVTVGQTVSKAEADGFKFDPVAGFVGDATFTYASIDANNREDATPAMVTIPVTGGNGGGHPGDCNEPPATDNKQNDALPNTVPAVNILNLSGTDCSRNDIEKFKITSLPDARMGVLYMADGVTAVTVGQVLTKEEADGIKFDPAEGFVGDVTFTYASIDTDNREDPTPATVTIPVVARNGGNGGANCTEAPITDDKRNVNLSNRALAVDIVDLSGTDCAGNAVEKFKIVTLPDANSGRLYMADGLTPVEVGQVLTGEEFRDLRFDPADGFVGDATFTYAAIDANDREDETPATVTLPIVAGAGGACTEDPITNDVKNTTNIGHNLAAVDIVNLEGLNCEGEEVERFRIATLPTADQGVLYMADGVTTVTVGQILTREEANGLRFDPADNFVGDATFTYSDIDANNRIDDTPATVTIPVVHPDGAGDNCTCKAYETSVPAMTPFGLLLAFILTLFVARRKFN